MFLSSSQNNVLTPSGSHGSAPQGSGLMCSPSPTPPPHRHPRTRCLIKISLITRNNSITASLVRGKFILRLFIQQTCIESGTILGVLGIQGDRQIAH